MVLKCNMRDNHSYHLPEDILIKVLHLLPLASILEWKLVSKQWKNLINHPKFFSHYRDKSLTSFVSNGSLYCVLTRHHHANPPCTVHRLPVQGAQKLVSEPSNVVACVGLADNHFLMYNLLTGASSTVVDAPVVNLPWHQRFGTGWVCYGFGYDHYDDDYKIVVVCNYRDHNPGKWLNPAKTKEKMIDFNGRFWVYSFGNRAWMTLLGFPYGADHSVCTRRACSLNGVLHWVFSKREDREETVVTYDLHTCRFGELSVPVDKDIWPCNLMDLGGELCYSVHDGYGLHVWVRKEYGVEESWTKLLSIDNSTSIPLEISIKDMALYESRDGEKTALFVCIGLPRLMWYDIEHGYTQVFKYNRSWKVKRG